MHFLINKTQIKNSSFQEFVFDMNMALVANDELLEAQAHIWNHMFNFINPMCLKCAIQLGIPDTIHSHGIHPMPLSQLVSSLQLHPNKTHFVYRLMRILTHSGFFVSQKLTINNEDEDEEEGYSLTNSSRLLLKDDPFSVTPFLLSMLESTLLEPWQFLATWFQTDDRTPFKTAHGMPFWEYTDGRPKDGDVFNAGMASDARLVVSVLLRKYKGVFDGIGSLVDVGGGTGTMAKAIAEAFPETECTVFDLPQVVDDLKGERNLKYVRGNMFQAIPPADAILLKWILHDWSDEECVNILKNCKLAITNNGNKGKVIVIDMVVGNKSEKNGSIETQLFMDMLMMVLAGGKEREEKEWSLLIKEAGFSTYKISHIIGLRSLIEIYP